VDPPGATVLLATVRSPDATAADAGTAAANTDATINAASSAPRICSRLLAVIFYVRVVIAVSFK
jgi:hypothetical protein